MIRAGPGSVPTFYNLSCFVSCPSTPADLTRARLDSGKPCRAVASSGSISAYLPLEHHGHQLCRRNEVLISVISCLRGSLGQSDPLGAALPRLSFGPSMAVKSPSKKMFPRLSWSSKFASLHLRRSQIRHGVRSETSTSPPQHNFGDCRFPSLPTFTTSSHKQW
jgi:hypothetical protein